MGTTNPSETVAFGSGAAVFAGASGAGLAGSAGGASAEVDEFKGAEPVSSLGVDSSLLAGAADLGVRTSCFHIL